MTLRGNIAGEGILRNIVLVAAAFIMTALTAIPASADTITWRIRSKYPYKLHMEFYSQNRDVSWPGGGRVYVLKDSRFHTYRLNCRRGETICYGAWVTTNQDRWWGVGAYNTRRCSSCCYRCGQHTRNITLTR